MKTIYKTSTDATKLAALKFVAKSLNLTPKNHKLSGFAEACYNDNSIDELVEALGFRGADKTDCENWQIKPSEWRTAIREALESRLYDAIEDVENA
jgi:uncharacterized membrane protein